CHGLFARDVAATLDSTGVWMSCEGILASSSSGDAVSARVGVSFPSDASDRYTRTGYTSGISPLLKVTVGLLGASPRFAFRTTMKAPRIADELVDPNERPPSERDFHRAWKMDAAFDPDLARDVVNDEL